MKLSSKPLFPFFAAHWKTYAALMAAGAAIGFLDLALVARAKQFLDGASSSGAATLFFQQVAFLLALYVALEGLRFWQDYEGDLLYRRVRRRLQDSLLFKITAAPMRLFLTQRRGDLLQRVMSDTQAVSHLAGSLASASLRDPIRVVVFGAILFKTAPAFGALAFLCAAVSLLLARRLQRRLTGLYEKSGRLEGSLYQLLESLLGHFPFLKIHNATLRLKEKWEQTNRELYSLDRRATRGYLGHRQLYPLFTVLLLGFLFLSAIEQWGFFPETPGAIVWIAGATYFCLTGLRNIAAHWVTLVEVRVQARRLCEVLEWRAETIVPAQRAEIRAPLEEVEARDLVFGYVPEKMVLRHLNWRLTRGTAVALTGENGSGKTTLSYLLLRLFDPQQGNIFYNRIAAEEIDPPLLRKRAGLVFQEPFLLDGSLEENLLFNTEGISYEKQREAMSAVGLGSLADSPSALRGFRIGHQGEGLSYGERQRLALARALLINPDFLILDEATSALDPDSENQILNELLRRRRDKITVVISHRLKSTPLLLETYLLKDGEIVRVKR